jgi:hypothetical protein
MFKLKSATVYYGASSYPLNGLPANYDAINGVEDIDAETLKLDVGCLTSFARDFDIRHMPRMEFPLNDGELVVIPEHIVAYANGYGIVWELAA